MNENINLAEILKDCPKGTKLYSPIFGEVYLFDFSKDGDIWVKASDNSSIEFFKDGKYSKIGECLLFPSKENRDWSTFKLPKKEFKKGDFVYRETDGSQWVSIHYGIDEYNCISSFIDFVLDNTYLYTHSKPTTLCHSKEIIKERLATEEEKQKLLKALDEKGYIWDEENLELRKKECEFKPFDKVLVKNDHDIRWKCDFFSHITSNENYPFYCVNGLWKYCIPYEGNEHLLGTTNNPLQVIE